MSRIGNKPIAIPAGVEVTVNGSTVTTKGPKGTLTKTFQPIINVEVKDNQVALTRPNDTKDVKAKHGLYRVLVNNMVKGVTEGFKKTIIVHGVGYKVTKQGNKVVMNIGFSHPVEIVEENGITLETPDATTIVVKGISKEAVEMVEDVNHQLRQVNKLAERLREI